MSDIQQEADEVTEILNTYCRYEALGRDGQYIPLSPYVRLAGFGQVLRPRALGTPLSNTVSGFCKSEF